MKIGLAGLPMSGKTSVFNAATRAQAETRDFLVQSMEVNTGVIKVPDPRIDFVVSIYNPKKTTYATVEFTDIPGISSGDKSASKVLDNIRACEAVMLVIRLFEDDAVPHVRNKIDPVADLDEICLEFILSDLEMVTNKIERIEKDMKAGRKNVLVKELELMERLKKHLEDEEFLSNLELTEEELLMVRGFRFFTLKPLMLVGNCSDEQFRNQDDPKVVAFKEACQERGWAPLFISAETEMEIATLSPEEEVMFLEEFGMKESARDRLISEAYRLVNYISFITYGYGEVRAWTIQKGTIAQKAAGKIHSDIERGFIRAEVIPFEAFKEKGNVADVKAAGLARLEGKEYVMRDGDMVDFRFNV